MQRKKIYDIYRIQLIKHCTVFLCEVIISIFFLDIIPFSSLKYWRAYFSNFYMYKCMHVPNFVHCHIDLSLKVNNHMNIVICIKSVIRNSHALHLNLSITQKHLIAIVEGHMINISGIYINQTLNEGQG